MELSIVLPCLNEAKTLATCIKKAFSSLHRLQVHGEVIVADNGSTDGSQLIAKNMGAELVLVAQRGNGNALRGGIAAARGKYIIMCDADDSYELDDILPFLEKLRQGYDLVVGNRFQGGIKPGAMPPLHRYLGNPLFSRLGNALFKTSLGDLHCGLRGFGKDAIKRLNLTSTGMEFCTEMVIKAAVHNLKITELPTVLQPDGRGRKSHLCTWRDGWRTLVFMIRYRLHSRPAPKDHALC